MRYVQVIPKRGEWEQSFLVDPNDEICFAFSGDPSNNIALGRALDFAVANFFSPAVSAFHTEQTNQKIQNV